MIKYDKHKKKQPIKTIHMTIEANTFLHRRTLRLNINTNYTSRSAAYRFSVTQTSFLFEENQRKDTVRFIFLFRNETKM